MSLAVLARRAFLTLIGLFIAAPLVVVTAVSFNETRRMSFPPTQFSLRWYKAFFADDGWTAALERSLSISAGAAVVAVLVALPLAYAVWRYGSKAAGLIAGVGSGLFLVPGVVAALMFSAFWSLVGHVGRMENVVLSHSVLLLGIPIALLTAGFSRIDKGLVEAANTMGADAAGAFRTVVLPAIGPYLVCALTYVFVLSLNEYLVAYMVAGFSVQTLPIRVFTNMRAGYEPTMCVGAVIFMVLGFGGFALLSRFADLPKLMGRDKPIPE